jgi:putative transport protein
LATTYVAAKTLGYNTGLAAGLMAGGLTNSGTLGVAVANLHQLGLNPTETADMASIVPIGYAVTYPFGTAGAAWFVSSLAPKMLGIDLKKACKEYEAASGHDPHSGQEMANFPLMARAFRVESRDVIGHTPREFNTTFGDTIGGAFITRFRDGAASTRTRRPQSKAARRSQSRGRRPRSFTPRSWWGRRSMTPSCWHTWRRRSTLS